MCILDVLELFFELTFSNLYLVMFFICCVPQIRHAFLLIFQKLSIFIIFLRNLVKLILSDGIKGQYLDKLRVYQYQERHNITSQIGSKAENAKHDGDSVAGLLICIKKS